MTLFDITTATPQQIVDKVAERLRDGRGRCSHAGACRYWREEDGNMCAVGYLLPDPTVLKGCEVSVLKLTEGWYDARLGEPVIVALDRHSTLLQHLQELHDTLSNWMHGGCVTGELNALGEGMFVLICRNHGLTYPEKEAA